MYYLIRSSYLIFEFAHIYCTKILETHKSHEEGIHPDVKTP